MCEARRCDYRFMLLCYPFLSILPLVRSLRLIPSQFLARFYTQSAVRSPRFILTGGGNAGVGAETVKMEVQIWEQNQTVTVDVRK